MSWAWRKPTRVPMSDAPPIRRPRHVGRQIWLTTRVVARMTRRLLPRVYAVALILVIVWLTFLSIRFLITSLATESGPPAQIIALPTRLDKTALGESRSAFAALNAAEHPRSPLAHYHRLDSWIRPDSFNDCARAGCHNPLPHSKRKEIRAFLNMHATSIHCGVCHFQIEERPRSLTWYGLTTGKPRQRPAILEAYAMITGPDEATKWKSADEARQDRLVSLLRRAARDAGGVSDLAQLADHFEAYRLGSPGFEQLLKEAPALLPRHFRGEYGAKLAVVNTNGRMLLGHPNTEASVQEWFAKKDSASKDERVQLIKAMHPLKRETALTCTDCHTAAGGLVDFAKAGYPPARVEQLTSPIIFRMIEHINAGQPFGLPSVIGGAPPESRTTPGPDSSN